MYLLIIKPSDEITLYDIHLTLKATDKAIEKCENDGVKWDLIKFHWNKTSKSWRGFTL